MRPRVVSHIALSVDGSPVGVEHDVGLFYELAGSFGEDATLTGAETMLAAPTDGAPTAAAPADAPLLVVTDSRGRVRIWERLLSLGYWRGGVALCSEETPPEHLDYLRGAGVAALVAGPDRVDLGAALERLASEHGVRTVRVDSGYGLLRALLAAGLLDELSVVLTPALAEPPLALRLEAVSERRGGSVWLRYSPSGRDA